MSPTYLPSSLLKSYTVRSLLNEQQPQVDDLEQRAAEAVKPPPAPEPVQEQAPSSLFGSFEQFMGAPSPEPALPTAGRDIAGDYAPVSSPEPITQPEPQPSQRRESTLFKSFNDFMGREPEPVAPHALPQAETTMSETRPLTGELPTGGTAPVQRGPAAPAGGGGSAPVAPDAPVTRETVTQAAGTALERAGLPTGMAPYIAGIAINEGILQPGTIARDHWSVGGVKAPGSAGVVTVPTREVVNGQSVMQNASFGKFNSMQEGMDALATFVRDSPRFGPVAQQAAQSGDYSGMIEGFRQKGYATDPNWTRQVNSIASGLPSVAAGQPPTPVAPTPAMPAPGASTSGAFDANSLAQQWSGKQYVFGGPGGRSTGIADSDCSGFVAQVTGLPAHTDAAYKALQSRGAVALNGEQGAVPGDPVFYMGAGTGGALVHHIGLYAGPGKVVDMSTSGGGGVKVRDIGHAGRFEILRDPADPKTPAPPPTATAPPDIVPTPVESGGIKPTQPQIEEWSQMGRGSLFGRQTGGTSGAQVLPPDDETTLFPELSGAGGDATLGVASSAPPVRDDYPRDRSSLLTAGSSSPQPTAGAVEQPVSAPAPAVEEPRDPWQRVGYALRDALAGAQDATAGASSAIAQTVAGIPQAVESVVQGAGDDLSRAGAGISGAIGDVVGNTPDALGRAAAGTTIGRTVGAISDPAGTINAAQELGATASDKVGAELQRHGLQQDIDEYQAAIRRGDTGAALRAQQTATAKIALALPDVRNQLLDAVAVPLGLGREGALGVPIGEAVKDVPGLNQVIPREARVGVADVAGNLMGGPGSPNATIDVAGSLGGAAIGDIGASIPLGLWGAGQLLPIVGRSVGPRVRDALQAIGRRTGDVTPDDVARVSRELGEPVPSWANPETAGQRVAAPEITGEMPRPLGGGLFGQGPSAGMVGRAGQQADEAIPAATPGGIVPEVGRRIGAGVARGAAQGAVAGGYEASQQEGATPESVLGAAALGAAEGGVLGGARRAIGPRGAGALARAVEAGQEGEPKFTVNRNGGLYQVLRDGTQVFETSKRIEAMDKIAELRGPGPRGAAAGGSGTPPQQGRPDLTIVPPTTPTPPSGRQLPRQERAAELSHPIALTTKEEIERLGLDKFPVDARDELLAAAQATNFGARLRRGVLGDEEVGKLAQEYAPTIESAIAASHRGKAYNAEEIRALRNLVTSQELVVRELSEEMTQKGFDVGLAAQLAAERGALRSIGEIAFGGAPAEAGRALRQFRLDAENILLNPAEAGRRYLQKQFGSLDKAEEAMAKYQQMVDDGADPVALMGFLRNARGGWWDRLGIMRYGGMLAQTTTHAINTAGGVTAQAVALGARPLMVGMDVGRVGAARAMGIPAERQVFAAEIPAQINGMRGAVPQSLKEAAFVMQHGFHPNDITQLDHVRGGFGTNIPFLAPEGSRRAGAVDFAFEWPLRALVAGDAIMRGIARGGYSAAEATAAAIKAGRTVDGKVPPAVLREFMEKPNIAERADELAKRDVLQEDTRMRQFNSWLKNQPDIASAAVSQVMPFSSTPYALVAQGVGLTPAGLGKAVNDMRHGKGARHVQETIARSMIGTAVMGGAAMQYANGNLTGPYPESEAERSTLPPGWREWSVKSTDANGETKYYPLAGLGQLGLPAAVAILIAEEHKQNGTVFTPEALGKIGLGVGKYMVDQTSMRGMSELAEAMSRGGGAMDQLLETVASSYSPQVIGGGGIGRQIQQLLGMPLRNPGNALEALLATHPATAGMVPVRRDVIGRPRTNSPDDIPEALLSTVVRSSEENDAPVIAAFRHAGEGLPLADPKKVRDSTTGESVILSRDQQERWRVVFGRSLREGWESYGRPTDTKTLRKVEADARDDALDAVLSR